MEIVVLVCAFFSPDLTLCLDMRSESSSELNNGSLSCLVSSWSDSSILASVNSESLLMFKSISMLASRACCCSFVVVLGVCCVCVVSLINIIMIIIHRCKLKYVHLTSPGKIADEHDVFHPPTGWTPKIQNRGLDSYLHTVFNQLPKLNTVRYRHNLTQAERESLLA